MPPSLFSAISSFLTMKENGYFQRIHTTFLYFPSLTLSTPAKNVLFWFVGELAPKVPVPFSAIQWNNPS